MLSGVSLRCSRYVTNHTYVKCKMGYALLYEVSITIKIIHSFLVQIDKYLPCPFLQIPPAASAAAKSLQSCPTLCDPIDSSLLGSSVHGISQARILVWVAISCPRRSSWLRDWTLVSCAAGRFLTKWATREAPFLFITEWYSVEWTYLILSMYLPVGGYLVIAQF